MRGLIPGLRRRPGVAGISPTLWFCGGWMAAEWHDLAEATHLLKKESKTPGTCGKKDTPCRPQLGIGI